MSGLPYKFEPGMRVVADAVGGGIVVRIDDEPPELHVTWTDGGGWWPESACTADLDHAGTRGLLLQQYRDASGCHCAVAVYDCDDKEWYVDPDLDDHRARPCGTGESEGAAILDALTRLAAERARESEQAKPVEGSEAIASAMLVEVAQRLRAVERRMSELERKVGQ